MKEYKVGEEITLVVKKVEFGVCNGCFFQGENYTCEKSEMICCPDERNDNYKVIFVEKGK